MEVTKLVIFSVSLLSIAYCLRFCDERKVAQLVRFNDRATCPDLKPDNKTIKNGTVMFFKPNLKFVQSPAYMCQYRITVYKTYLSFFGSKDILDKQEFTKAASRGDCLDWQQTKQCKRDGVLTSLTAEFGTELSHDSYDTLVKPVLKFNWLKEASITTTNCVLRHTWIRSVSPYKKIFSPFGVIHNTPGLTDSDYSATEQDRVVMWKPVGESKLCSYVLFQVHGNSMLVSEDNLSYHFVLPSLHKSIYVNVSSDKIKYSDVDYNHCLVETLRGHPNVSLYRTSGYGILAWYPGSVVNASISGDKDMTESIHKRSVTSRENLDLSIFFTEASIQWFMDKVTSYSKQSALAIARQFCSLGLRQYDLTVALAELNPSAVISSFLGTQVTAKKSGSLYALVPCKQVIRYKLQLYMIKNGICYSKPLVTFQLYPRQSMLVGQVNSLNQIQQPLAYTETCKSYDYKHFKVDGKWYHYINYTLSDVPDSSFDFLDLDANTKATDPIYLPHLTVDHLEVYSAEEERDIFDVNDAIDNLNRNNWFQNFITRNLINSQGLVDIPPEALAKGFSSMLSKSTSGIRHFFLWVKNSLLDPVLFFIFFVVVSIGSAYSCIKLAMEVFHLCRRTSIHTVIKLPVKSNIPYQKLENEKNDWSDFEDETEF